MKRIFLFGYYGFKNSGDDAILDAIIENLKSEEPDVDISVLTYNAKYTQSAHKVNVVSRSKVYNIIRTIKNCDLMISGGGSLLQDVTSSRSLLFYLGLITIGKLFNKKVMFFCNGYGPVNKKLNRFLIKKIVGKVDLITLRDLESKKQLEKLGITENVYVTADAAFTMKSANKERIKEIFKAESIPLDRETVGISVRKWYNNKLIKDVISKTIDYISDKGLNVVLIPMKYPDDLEISLEIKDMCKSNPYVIENYYTPEEVLGIIGEFSLLVGIRLHSLIFSAIKGVPVVGIEYDPKIKGFLDLVMQKSAGDIEKLDFANLCLCIDEVYNNREKYIKNIEIKRNEMTENVLKTAKMAIELLQDKSR